MVSSKLASRLAAFEARISDNQERGYTGSLLATPSRSPRRFVAPKPVNHQSSMPSALPFGDDTTCEPQAVPARSEQESPDFLDLERVNLSSDEERTNHSDEESVEIVEEEVSVADGEQEAEGEVVGFDVCTSEPVKLDDSTAPLGQSFTVSEADGAEDSDDEDYFEKTRVGSTFSTYQEQLRESIKRQRQASAPQALSPVSLKQRMAAFQ